MTQHEVDSLLSGGKDATRFTKRFLRKDGQVLWADLSSSVRRDVAGKPQYLMSAVVDITERKRAEAEIRQLNATLEQRWRHARAICSWPRNNLSARRNWPYWVNWQAEWVMNCATHWGSSATRSIT